MAGYIGNKSSVVSSGAERKFKFTITGTTTTLSNLAYTPNLVHVFHNGIRLVDGTDYTATNGTSITLTNAAENGDEVVVVSYSTFSPADTVSASAGGTFSGDVAVNGNLTVNTNTLFVDATNNRVGIGTSSPDCLLTLQSTGETQLSFKDTGGTSRAYIGTDGSFGSAPTGALRLRSDQGGIVFGISGSEAARIDSSGNLLVGKTTVDNSTAGGSIFAGVSSFVNDGARALTLVRKTSDGDLVEFRRDGTTVGSIGNNGGDMYIGTGVSGLLFLDTDPSITPHNTTTNAANDSAVDLGRSSRRFKDLYLSGGVYLGGTGAANLLDDYEEGTWTPTNAGAALTVTQAKYTKVGRMVTVACFVTANANTSGDWGGLPFTIDVNGTYSGSVGYQNDAAGETWNVFADGATYWTLRKGATSEQLLSGNNLRMTLTYFTT